MKKLVSMIICLSVCFGYILLERTYIGVGYAQSKKNIVQLKKAMQKNNKGKIYEIRRKK